jgi:hypothetical protein
MLENQALMQKYVKILDKNQEQVRVRMECEQQLQFLRQETEIQVNEVKLQLVKMREDTRSFKDKSK